MKAVTFGRSWEERGSSIEGSYAVDCCDGIRRSTMHCQEMFKNEDGCYCAFHEYLLMGECARIMELL